MRLQAVLDQVAGMALHPASAPRWVADSPIRVRGYHSTRKGGGKGRGSDSGHRRLRRCPRAQQQGQKRDARSGQRHATAAPFLPLLFSPLPLSTHHVCVLMGACLCGLPSSRFSTPLMTPQRCAGDSCYSFGHFLVLLFAPLSCVDVAGQNSDAVGAAAGPPLRCLLCCTFHRKCFCASLSPRAASPSPCLRDSATSLATHSCTSSRQVCAGDLSAASHAHPHTQVRAHGEVSLHIPLPLPSHGWLCGCSPFFLVLLPLVSWSPPTFPSPLRVGFLSLASMGAVLA